MYYVLCPPYIKVLYNTIFMKTHIITAVAASSSYYDVIILLQDKTENRFSLKALRNLLMIGKSQ